jgi:phosphatidylglycerophosphate synthase
MTVQERQSGASDTLGRADDRTRLEESVKTYDGFFSTFFVNPYTKQLAPGAARLGLAPTTVTLTSLALGLTAAACFALGDRGTLVAGAVLLLISFYLDGLAGTLARYTGRLTAFGGWLDSMADRCKEYAVYAGLALGSVRGFDDDVWVLACSALALQTVRHFGDVAYVRRGRSRPGSARTPANGTDRRAGRNFTTALRDSALPVWLHRIIRFPVGERLVVIAITAALASPRTTFVVLLAWGGLAALYTVGGRVLYDHPATRRVLRGVLG